MDVKSRSNILNIYKYGQMKYLIKTIIAGTSFFLVSCGAFSSPQAPSPKQINFKIQQVASGTPMIAMAMIPMDIPNSTQRAVTNDVLFRVTNNILGQPDTVILIPQDSLLKGVYYNDSTTCTISWQAIYGDFRGMELNQGDLTIANRLNNTLCDPKVGIKPGQTTEIIFK